MEKNNITFVTIKLTAIFLKDPIFLHAMPCFHSMLSLLYVTTNTNVACANFVNVYISVMK